MEIPKKCQGCAEIGNVCEPSLKSVRTYIREETGKSVQQIFEGGDNKTTVIFTDGSYADTRDTESSRTGQQVSTALSLAEADRSERDKKIAALVTDCPGVLAESVQIEDGAHFTNCAKVVMLAQNEVTPPQQ